MCTSSQVILPKKQLHRSFSERGNEGKDREDDGQRRERERERVSVKEKERQRERERRRVLTDMRALLNVPSSMK